MLLSTLLFTSGGLYVLSQLYRSLSEYKKRRIPKTDLFTLFDVALEDEDSDLGLRKNKTKTLVITPYKPTLEQLKTGQYFPQLYVTALKLLPMTLVTTYGVLVADYMADKIRKRAAQQRLKELNQEFEEYSDLAIELAKAKHELKSASFVKTAQVLSAIGELANTILSIPLSIFFPGLSHKELVHSYTMSVTPYAFMTAYNNTLSESATEETKRAIANYALQSRSFSVPAAASIDSIRKAIIYKYRAKQKEPKKVSPTTDYSAYFKSEAPKDEKITEHKDRLTINDIYNMSKEQATNPTTTSEAK